MARVGIEQQRVYTISLNELEASALLSICGHIGGDNAYRRVFSGTPTSLLELLEGAGVERPGGIATKGSVDFEE